MIIVTNRLFSESVLVDLVIGFQHVISTQLNIKMKQVDSY